MYQNYKISKNLFNVVMNVDVMILSIVQRNNSKSIQYAYNYLKTHNITINEFFFRCKDWAKTKNLSLISGRYGLIDDYFCEISEPLDEDIMEILYADSEQQAVFDACEWIILENKGTK